MKRFRDGQRVLVRAHTVNDIKLDPPAIGLVVRCRISDNGAWVALTARRDDAEHPFPPEDHRGTHILAYPENCEEAP